MSFPRLPAGLLGVLCLLGLAACEDPSNVGIGLIGEEIQPRLDTLAAATFQSVPLDEAAFQEVTGGNTTDGGAARTLAGRVADPLFGTLRATGHLDFGATGNQDVLAEDATIDRVELRLVRDYAYGDTTAPVTLSLAELDDEFDARDVLSFPPDTSLAVGEVLVPAFDVDVTSDSDTVVVTLPQPWVDANAETLRSGDFAANFPGFHLAPVAGEEDAVVGFSLAGSSLRVVTAEEDIASFPALKVFTGLARESDPSFPAEQPFFQDGLGPTVRLAFDFAAEAPGEVPVNGVVIRLFTDTETLAENPPEAAFVRPEPEDVELRLLQDTLTVSVVPGQLDDAGLRFSSPELTLLLQQALLGNLRIDAFELRAAPGANTISPLLFVDDGPEALGAAAFLTLAPSEP